ncbi:leucyl/phenylalanyl-tRNA--protein transferase [Albidovulum sp.]|uniref:leucyl/phenylalanyl-tRNA--protein transferase n=1 Tax=Albidovulum sp. TaxID=1872424 RepID=UPI001D39CD9A|nr:leucyl/phenylalanyl-tRNA--protein transferase [Paracoccaceae bacterium]MCC0046989.1 leucyl/phenylalanyl-tRNA--protein transferase [Defluviimonas sp.]HPE24226.1 leucyl/phenylalanyl-tRNA--protein transferase [Albidovulum sp.]MCB2152951.1 leucyl/phenylalanyl-tRNA--protein transferase [Paracoccaceae bacterium]MCB2159518.1 leucyl/phenylalanyl-tRNA--protein transferase [Paracoccaceae bacterium]
MLTAELMLSGYAHGIFPMAEGRDANLLHWVDPKLRGIFPLDNFHISRSLRRQILAGNYTIRTDTAFRAVVEACAGRAETWINAELLGLYDTLHAAGFAHSLEVWENGELAGGVFGIALGGAFFGESMFSARTGGSKIALAYLIDRLRRAGFVLFDTQFLTPHLASLGAIEISRADYRRRLASALELSAEFRGPETPQPSELVAGMRQRMTQTS